jgi:hypothetical protein
MGKRIPRQKPARAFADPVQEAEAARSAARARSLGQATERALLDDLTAVIPVRHRDRMQGDGKDDPAPSDLRPGPEEC